MQHFVADANLFVAYCHAVRIYLTALIETGIIKSDRINGFNYVIVMSNIAEY